MSQNQNTKDMIKRVNYDGLVYLLNDQEKTAGVFKLNTRKLEIIIPRSIFHKSTEYIVTSILKEAFSHSLYLKSIKFAEDSEVHTIEKKAFFLSEIESLSIPPKLTKFDRGWCKSTSKLRIINVSSNNPNFIFNDDQLLLGKSDLDESKFDLLIFAPRDIKEVNIPNCVKIIGPYSFELCKSIEKVNISIEKSELQKIERNSFLYSTINTISIPPKVKTISKKAFLNCKKLEKVEFTKDSQLETIERSSFSNTKIKTITFPSHLKIICQEAFYDCCNLDEVDFYPNSELQVIEKKAFRNSSIKTFSVPKSLKKICEESFRYCEKLVILDIPTDSELEIIEKDAFSNTSIIEFLITSKLFQCEGVFGPMDTKFTVMKDNPFFSIYNDIYIVKKSTPETKNYDVLVSSIKGIKKAVIPNFIEIIEPNAFYENVELEKVEFEENSKIRIIGSFSFGYCKKLRQFDIPQNNSNLQTIDECAFYNTLIESITIPSSVIQIGSKAFYSCVNLHTIIIPKDSKIQKIGEYAFRETSINKILIPPLLKTLEKGTFAFCKKLKIIDIDSNSELQTIDENAFIYTSIETLPIPPKLKELKYKWCCGLESVKNFNIMSNNFIYYKNKFLIGKTNLESDKFDCLLFANLDEDKVIIPNFIKKIASYSFDSCKNLHKLLFAKNSELEIIEKMALKSCSKIKQITIPPHVKIIGESAFFYSLEQVDIPLNSELQIIETLAFQYTRINRIYIPSHVIQINAYAFMDIKSLQKVVIPENSELQYLGKSAFENTSIESIFIPSNIKVIHERTFRNCEKLRKVEFAKNSQLEIIEKEAFYNSKIEYISLPSSLKIVEDDAFCLCVNIEKIDIPDNSQLQIFGFSAFAYTKIKSFWLPQKMERVDKCCFIDSKKFMIFEIGDDTNMEYVDLNWFAYNQNMIIMIAARLRNKIQI